MSGRWATSQRRQQLPPDWPTIRQRILERDHHRCTRCASTHRLEIHHQGAGDDHRDEMLVTLCHRCHATETAKQAAAARQPRPSAKRPAERHPGLRP